MHHPQGIYSGFFVLLLCVLASAPLPAAGQDVRMNEAEIKAGMLYSFLKYTDWPQEQGSDSGTIRVCLYGDDPFAGYLDNARGRTVQERAITVHTIRRAADAASCDLVFISRRQKSRWPALQECLRKRGILTVSDIPGFTRQGGMFEFGRKNDRINVTLNLDAVHDAGLKVQPRLLRIVDVVESRDDGNERSRGG